MIVQLTPTEAMTVKMIELNEAINGLGIPEGEAMTAVDGSKKGAEFAVAKALNLYPNLGGTLPVVPLVGRTHARVQVIWSKEPQASYNISRPRGGAVMGGPGTQPAVDFCRLCHGETVGEGERGRIHRLSSRPNSNGGRFRLPADFEQHKRLDYCLLPRGRP